MNREMTYNIYTTSDFVHLRVKFLVINSKFTAQYINDIEKVVVYVFTCVVTHAFCSREVIFELSNILSVDSM